MVPAPPVFAGLERATTCIPGPVGGDRSSRYHLVWKAAPGGPVAYRIYLSDRPGGEAYARPTWTTRRGASGFTTPPLPSNAAHYFVVRADDHDRNRREQRGVNLCV